MARIDNIITVNSAWQITTSLNELDKVTLKMWIYKGKQGNSAIEGVELTQDNDRVLAPTYTLTGSAVQIGTKSVVSFDVAPLIKDFIQDRLNQDHNADNALWVDIQRTQTINGTDTILESEHYYAVDGYEYQTDIGSSLDDVIRIPNRTILKEENSVVSVPLLKQGITAYKFMDGDRVISGTGISIPEHIKYPKTSQDMWDGLGIVNGTLTQSFVSSPATLSSESRLFKATASNQPRFEYVHTVPDVDTIYTFSVYVRKSTARYVGLSHYSESTNSCVFDLDNGTVHQDGGAFAAQIERFQVYSATWYRISKTVNVPASATHNYFKVTCASSANYYTGVQNEQFYVAGFQVEEGLGPTHYTSPYIYQAVEVTNLVYNSEELIDNGNASTGWISYEQGSATINVTNSHYDPEGTYNAYKFEINGLSSGSDAVLHTHDDYNGSRFAQSGRYNLSVWLRGESGGEKVHIAFRSRTSDGISTNAVTLTDQWERYSFGTYKSSSDATSGGFQFRFLTSEGIDIADQTFYAYGPQVEYGVFSAQHYVPTTTGPETWTELATSLYSDEQVLYARSNSSSVDSLIIDLVDGTSDTIYIEQGCTPRYEPVKLTFVNKMGAYQDVWFFGNLKKSTQVESDTWNRRNLIEGGGAHRPTTIKNVQSAKDSITINSGFYPEENNIVFEQLIQSNNVWITEGINTYPVMIKETRFNYKDSNTQKTINYTLNIEYAFNKIRSI